MRTVRTILLVTCLLAAPITSFAQGAPPKAGTPPAPTTNTAVVPAASGPSKYDISTEVDAAMTDKAQALFKEGNAFFRDAKYAQAQASYTAAWALDLRSQRLVRNLGLTELELKKYRDAAQHLTIALRLADAKDLKREAMKAEVAQARKEVGTIQMKIPVDGTEVVDMATGQSYTTPLLDPIFVSPGPVSFRIRREGYESQEKVFHLKAGEETVAEITLTRPAFGAGTGAATTGPVEQTTPRSKVPGFVLGGIGVVGLVAGGALLGVGLGKAGENRTNAPKDVSGNPLCGRTETAGEDPGCPDLRTNIKSSDTLGNAGIGVLIGGGVLVAAGVIYLFLLPKKTPAASGRTSRLVPVVSSDGGGLVWAGSF